MATKIINNRVNFASVKNPYPYPDFLDVQLKSFSDFLQLDTPPEERKNDGLYKVFAENFPITDTRNNFVLEFLDYFIDPPRYTIAECLERGLTYSVPLKAKMKLYCTDPDHEDFGTFIQDVFLGTIPYMTANGTFVINGAERVVVSQLHRSPGVFFGQGQHANGTMLYSARIIPFKGSWIEFSTDINNVMFAYIDRKKKLPVTTMLRAIGYETDKDILLIFDLCEDVKVTKKNLKDAIGRKLAGNVMKTWNEDFADEDIDETALSYAEIKMLATGNPYIKEKMDLDIQVQKLKLLKSNFLSEKYALEDKIIKYYPQRITALENRIEGLKQDVETAKQHPKPTDDRFVGMEVKGVFYSEKADAGKAIIEACKQMNSPDPIPFGKYRGFETELLFNTAERNYEVRLKGATSRNVPLGDDAYGNIIRLDNGIERFAESLSLAENDLENTKNQLETAKKEVQKPFIQEEELKTKLARLDELNILLNMDKRENEIVGGEPDEGEVPNTRKEKTYER